MGKLTISMAIFNSFLYVYQSVHGKQIKHQRPLDAVAVKFQRRSWMVVRYVTLIHTDTGDAADTDRGPCLLQAQSRKEHIEIHDLFRWLDFQE